VVSLSNHESFCSSVDELTTSGRSKPKSSETVQIIGFDSLLRSKVRQGLLVRSEIEDDQLASVAFEEDS
jgi:hypothetical protein